MNNDTIDYNHTETFRSAPRIACNIHQVEMAISLNLGAPHLDEVLCVMVRQVLPTLLLIVPCVSLPLTAYFFYLSWKEKHPTASHSRDNRAFMNSSSRNRTKRGYSLLLRAFWIGSQGVAHHLGFPIAPNYLDSGSVHPGVAFAAFSFGGCCYLIQVYIVTKSAQRLRSVVAIENQSTRVAGKRIRCTRIYFILVILAAFIIANVCAAYSEFPESDQAWQSIYLMSLRINLIANIVVACYLVLIFKYRVELISKVKEVVETQQMYNVKKGGDTNRLKDQQPAKSAARKKFHQLVATELASATVCKTMFLLTLVLSFVAYKASIWLWVTNYFVVAGVQYMFCYLDAWKIWQKRNKMIRSNQRREKQIRSNPRAA